MKLYASVVARRHVGLVFTARRIAAALGPGLQRLSLIKATWDPQNVFRTNRNVAPVR